MAMLELSCPACEALLELDAGFAGGVCRCFECGTLMTVPAGANRRAEELVPPQRPEAPMDRPTSPISEGGYTTASGQTVRIDRRTAIPTARRRRTGVRVTTAAIFFIILLAIVGASVAAIMVLLREPPPPDYAQLAIEQAGYDPSVNPYQLERPNLLGLPLADRTAIIIDASGTSRDWLSMVKRAAALGLTRKGSEARVRVIYATEPRPIALQEGFVPLSQLQWSALTAFQENITARGVAPLHDALAHALDDRPNQVILVTSQSASSEQVDVIEDVLRVSPGVVFDAVTIGSFSSGLEDASLRHKGRYIDLPRGQVERWYRAANR